MLKEIITVTKGEEGYELEGVTIALRDIAILSYLPETKYRFVLQVTSTEENEERVAELLGKLEYDGDIHIRNKSKFEKKYEHLW
jgi:hypothetical protein